MQKRTNPLALKSETPSRPLTRRVSPFEQPQVPVEDTPQTPPVVTPVPQPAPQPVPPTPAPVVADEPAFVPERADESDRPADTDAAVATTPYGWQFIKPRTAEPVEQSEEETVAEDDMPVTEEIVDDAEPPYDAADETAPVIPPVTATEQTADDAQTEEPDPVSYGVEEDDTSDARESEQTEEQLADEVVALGLEDYELAARFSLCGRVGRKTKLIKISSDVGRLAQLMHPDESLSAIVENALLTRIYLENRDAFDAMAEMIEKKGGHIKC